MKAGVQWRKKNKCKIRKPGTEKKKKILVMIYRVQRILLLCKHTHISARNYVDIK